MSWIASVLKARSVAAICWRVRVLGSCADREMARMISKLNGQLSKCRYRS